MMFLAVANYTCLDTRPSIVLEQVPDGLLPFGCVPFKKPGNRQQCFLAAMANLAKLEARRLAIEGLRPRPLRHSQVTSNHWTETISSLRLTSPLHAQKSQAHDSKARKEFAASENLDIVIRYQSYTLSQPILLGLHMQCNARNSS